MKAGQLRLHLLENVRGLFSGDFQSIHHDVGGLGFESIRLWQPGDPPGAILKVPPDPLSGLPKVRIAPQDREGTAMMYIDASESEFASTVEQTKYGTNVRIARELAPTFAKAGCRVGFWVFTERMEFFSEPVITRTDINSALGYIRKNQRRGGKSDLASSLKGIWQRNLKPDVILIVSDLASQTDHLPILKKFRAQNQKILILHFVAEDPLEARGFKTRGEFLARDAESGKIFAASEIIPNPHVARLRGQGFAVAEFLTTDSDEELLEELVRVFARLRKAGKGVSG